MQRATGVNRRSFLSSTVAAGGGLALAPHARALGANDDIRVAVVGFRGQGGLHLRKLRELSGVRVVAVCDADQDVLDRELNASRKRGEKLAGYTDVRKLLEDRNIDALTTATPDHWHALITIWACQAGKDVYVEKPVSHNLWEGRRMVEAARKYNRVVQYGNHNHPHSTGEIQLETDRLGEIQVVWSSLNRGRTSIGKVTGPQPVPKSVNYDLWSGPAPMKPLMRKRFHYDWHWDWSTGTGEMGNNGIYPLTEVRLALGQNTLPRRVLSLGGRFTFDDDGRTPNSQLALFQYEPGPMVIFELRNLPSEKGPKTVNRRIKCEHGETGLPGLSGEPGDTGGFTAHKGHLFNFISAVRRRNVSDLRADILEGHLSTALVHMANASYRVGTSHTAAEVRDVIQDRGGEATETLGRFQEHLAANGVDFSKSQMVLGPWLEMNAEREEFVGGSDTIGRANQLLRGSYRKPFEVPQQV
ncbi:MAG: Gfo/Idh/MocA family oxidoreductase [Fuerstiella sp.]|nr:Gfo/Idh/MocA family oxidoreductase [Fuerstiella sp.]MCP4853710.1 Gfo/Idh/MocA family oxidoreductase [Fuerstiella sp.]